MNHIRRANSYINYLHKSRSASGTEIPFIQDLFVNQSDTRDDFIKHYGEVAAIRSELERVSTTINVADKGAGPGTYPEIRRKISEIAGRSTQKKKYLALQYRMIRKMRPSLILELGTSFGFTTALFAKAAPEASIITIEGCPATSEIARQNFKKLNINNITLINGSFEETLEGVFNQYGKVDYLFFDGNHRMAPTLNYFLKALLFKHEKSIFVFDDIRWSEQMEAAWAEILKHPDITLSIELYATGIVMFDRSLPGNKLMIRY